MPPDRAGGEDVTGNGHRHFQRGFGIVAKSVMRDKSIGVPARTLYALLATYADDDGLCMPSNETLAADLGTTERTVRRLVSELAEHGVLARRERFVDGRQTTSQTVLTDLVSWREDTNVPLGEDTNVPLGEDTNVLQNKTTRNKTTRNNLSSTADAASDAATRLDVERLCRHLADRIEDNGGKRPEVGKRWRDSARLLLDRDGYTEDQVRWIINWSHDDEFWRANILSMPKLREKFEHLRMKSGAAQRQQRSNSSGPVIDMSQDLR